MSVRSSHSCITIAAGCAHALVYAFIRVEGRGWGCTASLCKALDAWRWGLFPTEGEIWVWSCVLSYHSSYTPRYLSIVTLYTHRYIGLGNACCAGISVFSIVIHDCIPMRV